MNLLARLTAFAAAALIGFAPVLSFADGTHDVNPSAALKVNVAVGPQYDTTHVYVPSAQFDAFVQSFVATFDGKASQKAVFTVTPTPSKTASQYVGMLSVFGFEAPVPYPFGNERTGYLVTDIDDAVKAARAASADVIVEPFDDPIGKDAIIQWPGGLTMQLYWHTKAPNYAPLHSVPNNRVYVSRYEANNFVHRWLRFSHGRIVADDKQADAGVIGRPGEAVRQIRIESKFGRMLVFVTDGKLPFPFGRETTGCAVDDVSATLERTQANGAKVLYPAYAMATGKTAMLEFPGGYIAEVHDGR